jgi:hypothetical protein
MSMDRPRQPAFWRFEGVGVVGIGGFDGFSGCARTFATKSTSYRARSTSACCFAPDSGAGVDADAREDVEVREVVVPCERMEERSEAVVVVD